MEEIKIKGYGNRFNEKIAKDMLKKIKPKIYSIVPVKKNSSRLPNKNILPFGNSTLLEHKISQLKKVKGIGWKDNSENLIISKQKPLFH